MHQIQINKGRQGHLCSRKASWFAMNGRVEVSEREVKYEPRERQDQILRILNAMLKIFLLNAECDVFGRYSSGDVLQHRRVSGSGGWCQVGNRHLEDIKVHWLMRLLVAGRGLGG